MEADKIISALDISQMALSSVEIYMCGVESGEDCEKVGNYVSQLKEINAGLLRAYEDDSEITRDIAEQCLKVDNLWGKIKRKHSVIIVRMILNQFQLIKEDVIKSGNEAVEVEIDSKIQKFYDMLADLEDDELPVTNNTYHILLEMQDNL